MAAALALSAINPHDRLTWLLEVMPVLIVYPLMLATRHRWPLTPLLHQLIAAHALVLILGAAYTYARVPLGFSLADLFNTTRNPYDKVGHFFQGFVPAIATREILIRGNFVNGRKMRCFLVLCVVLAASACYEFIEWWAALILGQGADQFLGTQGDSWDTQSDMFCAVLGAVLALLGLSGVHDRQLRGR